VKKWNQKAGTILFLVDLVNIIVQIAPRPEDGTCQVLDDWEIEKWGSCKVLEE